MADWLVNKLFDETISITEVQQCPLMDANWGPPSHLSNGYQGLFPKGKRGQGVKLTTHLHLVPSSRTRVAIPPLPSMPS